MFSPSALTLALLGLASSLQAQQSFVTGETVELPSMAVGAADHATLATNSFGDVFIANHADAASGSKLVEGTAIASLGNHAYRTSPTLLLGDPSLALLGADTCRKPDVEAMKDGSFVVVWPRNDRNHVAPSRLEAARIVLRDANGVLLAMPEVHTASPGRGYLLDSNITSGDAGIMPDLVWLGRQDALGCAVVYAHELSTSQSFNKVFREYELRCVRINWAANPHSSSFRDGPYVLASPIPWDNLLTDPFNGGLILPDVVLDDSSNLVVAFEESIVAPHLGYVGPNRSRICILRFQAFGSSNPLQAIDAVNLSPPASTHRTRRPNLSSSRADLTDSISVSYALQGLQSAISAVGYQTVDYIPGGNGGYSTPQNAYWIQDPQKEDGLPTTANNGSVRSCFSSRQYPGERKLLTSIARSTGINSFTEVTTPILYPWRPAVKLVTYNTPSTGNNLTFAAICYEGDDTATPSTYRIYFTYLQL